MYLHKYKNIYKYVSHTEKMHLYNTENYEKKSYYLHITLLAFVLFQWTECGFKEN